MLITVYERACLSPFVGGGGGHLSLFEVVGAHHCL